MVTLEDRITRLEDAQEFNTQQLSEILSRVDLVVSKVEESRREAREMHEATIKEYREMKEATRKEYREIADAARKGARERNNAARNGMRKMVSVARPALTRGVANLDPLEKIHPGGVVKGIVKPFHWWNPFDVMDFISGNDRRFKWCFRILLLVNAGIAVTIWVLLAVMMERMSG